jgi:hypothetical protein
MRSSKTIVAELKRSCEATLKSGVVLTMESVMIFTVAQTLSWVLSATKIKPVDSAQGFARKHSQLPKALRNIQAQKRGAKRG